MRLRVQVLSFPSKEFLWPFFISHQDKNLWRSQIKFWTWKKTRPTKSGPRSPRRSSFSPASQPPRGSVHLPCVGCFLVSIGFLLGFGLLFLVILTRVWTVLIGFLLGFGLLFKWFLLVFGCFLMISARVWMVFHWFLLGFGWLLYWFLLGFGWFFTGFYYGLKFGWLLYWFLLGFDGVSRVLVSLKTPRHFYRFYKPKMRRKSSKSEQIAEAAFNSSLPFPKSLIFKRDTDFCYSTHSFSQLHINRNPYPLQPHPNQKIRLTCTTASMKGDTVP